MRAQGPAVIAQKLSYFIQTGQMVQLLKNQGFRVSYLQLSRFSPLPGDADAAPPAPDADAAASAQASPTGARVPSTHRLPQLVVQGLLRMRTPCTPVLQHLVCVVRLLDSSIFKKKGRTSFHNIEFYCILSLMPDALPSYFLCLGEALDIVKNSN